MVSKVNSEDGSFILVTLLSTRLWPFPALFSELFSFSSFGLGLSHGLGHIASTSSRQARRAATSVGLLALNTGNIKKRSQLITKMNGKRA